MEENMTDRQMLVILKLVQKILVNAKDLDEARKEVDDLISSCWMGK